MELLSPPVSSRPRILSGVSLFTPSFSIKTRNVKNPRKFHKISSIPLYLRFSPKRNVHVSAHFGRPTSRRNSLREKLIDDQQVRQRNPISQNPSSDVQNPSLNFDNISSSQENLDCDSVKESDSSHGWFGVDNDDLVEAESVNERKPKSKKLGESVLLTKLETWVDQCKKDTAYWGIGSGPIFTVFHDVEGKAKRVLVNEDEILKRCQVGKQESEDLTEGRLKILYARGLAREMERGANVIPKNSSVAKFVALGEESGFVNIVQHAVLHPEFIPVLSIVGRMVVYGFVAIWAVKKLFTFGNQEERYTELEKEMMRRKIKSRKQKEMLEKGRVEIVEEPLELPVVSIERPKLDKQELMKNISEAKASKDKLVLVHSSSSLDAEIQKIRAMARQARKIESREHSMVNKDDEEKQPMNKLSSSEMPVVEDHTEKVVSFPSVIQNRNSGQEGDLDETGVKISLEEPQKNDNGCLTKISSEESTVTQAFSTEFSEDRLTMLARDVNHLPSTHDDGACMPRNKPIRMKPKVIRSVEEARDFLAKKGDKHRLNPQVNTVQESTTVSRLACHEVSGGKTSQKVEKVFEPLTLGRVSDSLAIGDTWEDPILKEKNFVPAKNNDSKDSGEGHGVRDIQKPETVLNHDINGSSPERIQSVKMENWMEKNFHEVEPIVKKIGDGLRDNFKVAREKVNQHTNASIDVPKLKYNGDDSELEWMKDDGLREIVFRVQENELAGRDPFYLMDAEDKLKFFKGLEEKVQKENEKLLQVHEYLHSNIENLDYGADGISLYDPPEKFIPRWKGPPLDKNPEFLNNLIEQKNAISAVNAGNSYPVNKNEQSLLQKSTESVVDENAANSLKKNLHDIHPKDSKTIIEGSDGSVRAGKKSGKEYWQHTKKWSRGFLESYNAETDPEIKSIMKDIGKDLDRWISEEEIQEAADLMTNLPERNKKFLENKINKLKREMELFGPQAVVSKYSEYAEEKEEDYLWWLDLPHILCIELYTVENGEQRIGFYSLEMAADLELEPKPYHVVAFEDAGDCKNLCYIIQAHMEMLGNGHAFIVPRLPKDVFREAKAHGFSVTVIRKEELQLNVDETLEEVEEQIAEIGSKIYHDKLMRERSVDINSLMRGVFGVTGQSTSTKRKLSKRKLKKPSKK